MAVYVLSKTGERLMPTVRYGRVRHLLKEGKAHIYAREPFTIQLDYETTAYIQDLELCVSPGSQHIGLSLKSEKREYERRQYDLLPDEKERHDDQRMHRRTRRNRLRYRAPRFNNRQKPIGWFAPSIRNKEERHIDIIRRFIGSAPVERVYIGVATFDTQLLEALEAGQPIPEGADYQHGPRYGFATLREAVFYRDNYQCVYCGRSALKDNAILHVHHAYFWRGERNDRMAELATCCEKCNTSANHQPGGKLWGYDKPMRKYRGAAFMNIVRRHIYDELKNQLPCEVIATYGAATKLSRSDLGLEKSHSNDAYAMGALHPQDRTTEQMFRKRRRNNRILEKFYDSKIIDQRTGEVVSGKDLCCGRNNRRESRTSEKSLRKYRGEKVKKGCRRIRKCRYSIRPGDLLRINGAVYHAKGVQGYGKIVKLQETKKTVSIKKVKCLRHISGWEKVS